jgi:hypothetical protein
MAFLDFVDRRSVHAEAPKANWSLQMMLCFVLGVSALLWLVIIAAIIAVL